MTKFLSTRTFDSTAVDAPANFDLPSVITAINRNDSGTNVGILPSPSFWEALNIYHRRPQASGYSSSSSKWCMTAVYHLYLAFVIWCMTVCDLLDEATRRGVMGVVATRSLR